jgi:hypothetical protein
MLAISLALVSVGVFGAHLWELHLHSKEEKVHRHDQRLPQ